MKAKQNGFWGILTWVPMSPNKKTDYVAKKIIKNIKPNNLK